MTGRTTSFCTVTSPDKAKQNYFLFLFSSLYILSEIKLCAESQKHFLSFQNSYLVNNNNTTLYQFSLLEAATKPNLSSFSAGLAVLLLRSDQSGAGQADQDPTDHSLSLVTLTHNSCLACDLILGWCVASDQGLHLTTPVTSSRYKYVNNAWW